jgi:ferritin-like metal-binding protein YciE
MTQNELFLHWLNDAYTMEKSQVQLLGNHLAEFKEDPPMHEKLEEHLDLSRYHADMLAECIQRLGENLPSERSGSGGIFGVVEAATTGFVADEPHKNVLANYAMEHFEIASYVALIEAARLAGHEEFVPVFEEIIDDEEDMAAWLEQHVPVAVDQFMSQHAGA